MGILLSQVSTYYSIYHRTDKPHTLYLFIPALVAMLLGAAGLEVAGAYIRVRDAVNLIQGWES